MGYPTFRLTILGSGTTMPTAWRHPSAYLLEWTNHPTEHKNRILLDAGHGTLTRLVDKGINPHSIETLFISHFHVDHFTDAFPLISARWVDDIYKNQTSSPLTILGPEQLQERFKKWREIYWCEPKEQYRFEMHEGSQTLQIGEASIELFPVKHVPWFQSLGIKISRGKKTFLYTGDIGSDHPWDDLVQRCRNLDLLLIEAGALVPRPNHFTMEQIVRLRAEAEIKKVIATHLRDPYLETQKALIKNHPQIILAEDGAMVEF